MCNWLECKKDTYRLWASRLVWGSLGGNPSDSHLPTGSVGRVTFRTRRSYGYVRLFSQYCSFNQV